MRLLVWLIGMAIRVASFPARLGLGAVRAIGRRLRWLRPLVQIALKLLVAVRRNSVVSTAITLSVINFGLLVWQIWPEDTEQTMMGLSQPAQPPEATSLDDTQGRITELENQIRDLSREQRFRFDRLRDCINYPSPFGCE